MHQSVEVALAGHCIPLHGLKTPKVVEDVEENIVEQIVVFDIMVKPQTVIGHRV